MPERRRLLPPSTQALTSAVWLCCLGAALCLCITALLPSGNQYHSSSSGGGQRARLPLSASAALHVKLLSSSRGGKPVPRAPPKPPGLWPQPSSLQRGPHAAVLTPGSFVFHLGGACQESSGGCALLGAAAQRAVKSLQVLDRRTSPRSYAWTRGTARDADGGTAAPRGEGGAGRGLATIHACHVTVANASEALQHGVDESYRLGRAEGPNMDGALPHHSQPLERPSSRMHPSIPHLVTFPSFPTPPHPHPTLSTPCPAVLQSHDIG